MNCTFATCKYVEKQSIKSSKNLHEYKTKFAWGCFQNKQVWNDTIECLQISNCLLISVNWLENLLPMYSATEPVETAIKDS